MYVENPEEYRHLVKERCAGCKHSIRYNLRRYEIFGNFCDTCSKEIHKRAEHSGKTHFFKLFSKLER